MTVEREREILAFDPVEYWSIEAELAKRTPTRRGQPRSFTVALFDVNGRKADLPNETSATTIVTDLEGAGYAVDSVRRREQQRNPPAPFTTSTPSTMLPRMADERFRSSVSVRIVRSSRAAV